MNTVDKLIDHVKYSNLFCEIGYDDWDWILKHLDTLKTLADKDEEVALNIQKVISDNIYLFGYLKKNDSESIKSGKPKYFLNHDSEYGGASLAASYYAIGCIKIIQKILGLNITPKPIQLALLAIKGGMVYENRKKNLTDLAKHFDLNYETLSATHGRLVKDEYYKRFCYHTILNKEKFVVKDNHKIHSEWFEDNYKELQQIFSWLK